MARPLRILMRASLWLAVLLVAAQLLHVVASTNFLCDFPNDCLARAYPTGFEVSETLWRLSVGAAILACVAAVLTRSGPLSVLRLTGAAVLAWWGHLLSPLGRIDDPAAWLATQQPLDQHGAWRALLVFAAALVVYGWDVIVRLHAAAVEEEAADDERRTRTIAGVGSVALTECYVDEHTWTPLRRTHFTQETASPHTASRV